MAGAKRIRRGENDGPVNCVAMSFDPLRLDETELVLWVSGHQRRR